MDTIVVTEHKMLLKLGFTWPTPSYVEAIPALLMTWLAEHNPSLSEGEKHALIGDMHRFNQAERLKPHTIEHRVARQKDEYKLMCNLVDTVDERRQAMIAEWAKDPEYKAALHAHDHIFKK